MALLDARLRALKPRLFFIDRERVEYAASFEANNDLAAEQVVRKRQNGRVVNTGALTALLVSMSWGTPLPKDISGGELGPGRSRQPSLRSADRREAEGEAGDVRVEAFGLPLAWSTAR